MNMSLKLLHCNVFVKKSDLNFLGVLLQDIKRILDDNRINIILFFLI